MKQFFLLLFIVLLSIANHHVMDNARTVLHTDLTVIENQGAHQSCGNHFTLESEHHHHDEYRLINTVVDHQGAPKSQRLKLLEHLALSNSSLSFWQPPKIS